MLKSYIGTGVLPSSPPQKEKVKVSIKNNIKGNIMDERFTSALSIYLRRDKKLLVRIQRNRGALRNNKLNERLIRKCARESLQSFIQLFKDNDMPVKQICTTIQRYYEKGDDENIFCLIFFYCEYFGESLPDLQSA
jgi:hypothetical protein